MIGNLQSRSLDYGYQTPGLEDGFDEAFKLSQRASNPDLAEGFELDTVEWKRPSFVHATVNDDPLEEAIA
jgi:hypothetical protein